MNINLNIYNVTITGLAFFFLFAAFQTASLTAQNVLEAVSKQRNNSFDGTGYTSLAIVYISFGLFNWFAPIVVMYLGEKYSMIAGSFCYAVYIASYIEPFEWSLYLASFVNGIGAAVLWTAQGAFITDCSTKSNLNQHFSLFWGLFQANQIVGGLYAYLSLSNIDEISPTLRIQLYGGLLGCAVLGILLLFTLRKPHKTDISHQQLINVEINSSDDNLSQLTPDYPTIQDRSTVFQSTLHSLRRSVKILTTKPMICILVAAAFTGINLTFYSSLYASALGHCLRFGRNAKSYIGLAGLFIGIGEIVEGVLVIFGYISAIVAGYFTFMMLPTNSSIKDTDELSYITPNVYLAMLIAFLFGGVDSVWNTQISALIGFIYGEHGRDVTVGFALFKSVQSIVSGIAFVYSTYLLLHWQILIFVVMATSGLYCLLSVYWSHLSRSVNLIA
ncbi:et translation product-related [Schistosoma mansoni]|uniref:et translation product-related n=1 Tax=Schistosoma mansoni TaxID=6183 RepID=UPI0001A61B81|nr:et translation product-related [Schistosoma mansoni]|eukprot:XP_018653090.1 et translation product-related [Schistosoma mansoni]